MKMQVPISWLSSWYFPTVGFCLFTQDFASEFNFFQINVVSLFLFLMIAIYRKKKICFHWATFPMPFLLNVSDFVNSTKSKQNFLRVAEFYLRASLRGGE